MEVSDNQSAAELVLCGEIGGNMNDYKELVENLREEADAVQAMGNANKERAIEIWNRRDVE